MAVNARKTVTLWPESYLTIRRYDFFHMSIVIEYSSNVTRIPQYFQLNTAVFSFEYFPYTFELSRLFHTFCGNVIFTMIALSLPILADMPQPRAPVNSPMSRITWQHMRKSTSVVAGLNNAEGAIPDGRRMPSSVKFTAA